MKKICKTILTAAIALSSYSAMAEDVTVLVLYTNAVEALYPNGAIDDRIEAYIDATNDSYATSNIDMTFSLAEGQLIPGVDDTRNDNDDQNYDTDTALRDLTASRGVFANVGALRNTFGADFVVLLREIQDTGGLGWVDNIGNRDDLAFNVVRIKNPLSSFTHELGHNMGLAHSRRQVAGGGVAGIEPYAAGHGLDRVIGSENGFVTIMAYNTAFNRAPSIDVISNPNIDCTTTTSTTPCGVNESNSTDGANAARVLQERRADYGNYRLSPTLGSVSFSDSNLSSCIAPSQNVLIPNYSNMECTNLNIESLNGVENLTSLTFVNVQDNNLFSLQPLFELPNLVSAVVSGNDRAICSHLTQLESKLGSGNVVRSSKCFPLAATLVSINGMLL
jgi:hypothetical protein